MIYIITEATCIPERLGVENVMEKLIFILIKLFNHTPTLADHTLEKKEKNKREKRMKKKIK